MDIVTFMDIVDFRDRQERVLFCRNYNILQDDKTKDRHTCRGKSTVVTDKPNFL